MELLLKALGKAAAGMLCLGLLLFLPAGTWAYPKAWLLLALLFIPMIVLGLLLYFKAPELLRKRLNEKESNPTQKIVILASALLFVAVFVLAGLDFRCGWSELPRWLVILAAVIFLAGYALYAEVLRENAYLSRTVEVQAEQKVIDSGLYAWLRHPMYFATLLMFFSLPLVLGSLYACLLMLVGYPFLIVPRILDEEKTLAAGLEGYSRYMEKVKYRLLPFIW